MQPIPRISESEWEVMKIVWVNAHITANEVVDQLEGITAWKPKTIKTLLNRLLKKEALGFEKKGQSYVYYPLVTESECVKSESQSFLNRVYGGAVSTMLVSFLEEQTLSKEDIEQLKRILDKKE